MKAQLGIFAAFVGLLSGGQVLASPTSSGPRCDLIDISGKYQSRARWDGKRNLLVIKQNGCMVTVNDLTNHAKWQFDLTGKTEAVVPKAIIDANKDYELARRSFESMRITTLLTQDEWHRQRIQVTVRENLPKVAPTPLHPGNAIDADIQATTNVWLMGSATPQPDGTYKQDQVTGISIDGSTKIRLVKINDLAYAGPLASAFVSGANWVLKWTDDNLFQLFDFMNLERIP